MDDLFDLVVREATKEELAGMLREMVKPNPIQKGEIIAEFLRQVCAPPNQFAYPHKIDRGEFVPIMRAVRNILGCSLVEAKDLVLGAASFKDK